MASSPEYFREYYRKNREKRLAEMKAYRERNRAKIVARKKERYWADPEPHRERARQYAAENAEAAVVRAGKWQKENAEHRREYLRKYREQNRAQINASVRKRRKQRREEDPAFRDYERDKCAQRTARKKGAPRVENIDRAAIIARDGSRCHICGQIVPAAEIELDHLVPLSKGGEHTATNLRVAHGRCNRKRGDGRIPAQLILT